MIIIIIGGNRDTIINLVSLGVSNHSDCSIPFLWLETIKHDYGRMVIMAAGGDCVELVHVQQYLEQECHNVYYFEAVIGGASLEQLAAWFETNVVAALKTPQSSEASHSMLKLRNLFDLGEVWEEPLTGTGVQTAGATELPAFFAASIRLDHSNAVVRPGFKRYVGWSETDIVDSLWEASVMASLATLADRLVNPPSVANPDWAHVIVNRICEVPNPDPLGTPSCLKYRLPESQAEFNPGYPIGYEVIAQPTTQNSRKWYT